MSEKTQRKVIIDKWLENQEASARSISKQLKIPNSTVSRVIKRFKEEKSLDRKSHKNRVSGARNEKLDEKIIKTIQKNRSMSVRDIASLHRTTRGMVQRAKKRAAMKTRKKKKVPKVTPEQRKKIKTRARKLYDFIGKNGGHLILDDETYVKADFSTIAGPQYYTMAEGELLTLEESSIAAEKFGAKYLVWQAICECGLKSQSFFTNVTINKQIYIDECLKKRLLPFIRKHDVRTLFWPDLAPAHYAGDTINFMNRQGIHFVDKNMNPPNVPQCRPIERYWALVKAILRKTGQRSTDIKSFAVKWIDACRKIKRDAFTKLMKRIKPKLRVQWTKPIN